MAHGSIPTTHTTKSDKHPSKEEPELPEMTREEVANLSSDGRIIFVIHNKVYDVTRWAEAHPGGIDVLMDEAGRDATDAFDSVGHTNMAKKRMKRFLVATIAAADYIDADLKGMEE